MKIKKVVAVVLISGALGLSSGFMLSGCSGVNNSLEKEHIMNGGCFITCYNKAKTGKYVSAGKYAGYAGHKADGDGINNKGHFKKIKKIDG
ncbi:MAG: hypothetical protein ACYCSB_02640 [bacterium]